MTKPKPWRFYGREEEVAELTKGLHLSKEQELRKFRAIKVRGRRGVGKTGLLREMARRARGGSNTPVPFIRCELPSVVRAANGSLPPDEQDKALNRFLVSLFEKAQQAVFEDLEKTLPSYLRQDSSRLQHVLWTLLQAGAVVVLDEFHHAADMGLAGDIKLVIDEAAAERHSYPGKIVLMGSHQQKFDDMFGPDKALYGRIDQTYQLNAWRLKTIMIMAAEQGILVGPEKFLTLFTAYDGLPRHWERYCTDERYEELHTITDERQWRQDWLAVERKVLDEPRERWDSKVWIELKDTQRDLLLWIGQNKPRGVRLSRIAPELDLGTLDDKLEMLKHLRRWLGMVDQTVLVGESDKPRWAITELNTLFQINVFRDINPQKDHQPPASLSTIISGSDEVDRTLTYMESLEGEGLERLAADWLAAKEGVTWHGCRVRHPGVSGDIDALATRMKPGQEKVWLGNCKRNQWEHKLVREDGLILENGLAKIRVQQDRFMDALATSAVRRDDQKSADNLTQTERVRLLFSRVFSSVLRQEYKENGFEPVDIRDMARSFGIDPDPAPVPQPDKPAEDKLPPPPPPPRDGDVRRMGVGKNNKGLER